MKSNKKTVRFNLLVTLICFSVCILIFLWIFQILALNTMYKIEKKNTIKEAAKTLTDAYNTNNFITIYNELAHGKDICIELTDSNENIIFSSSNYNKKCLSQNNKGLRQFQTNFIENGFSKQEIELVNPNFNNNTLVYGYKIDDNSYMFINSSLVPLDDSINLLKNQFIYIALTVLLMAVFMAIFISRHISKPIIKLTDGAKKLKNKDYGVRFDTNSSYSEINELSDTLNGAVKELSKTDELRRDLMANVSHDLKTPLTMIKAYAEAARDLYSDKKEKRNEDLNIIIAETERLNILVNDILSLSKLESNIEKDQVEEINITELIKEILKRYTILQEEGYKFIFNYKKDKIVKASKKELEQVIYNLINNAINYTGDDNVVEISIEELNKKKIRIKIIDTGKGINSKDINLIWDKYYKNEKKHKRNKYGTGLGLSIVKNIFIKNNLNYGVESNKKGTTFYFDINVLKTK